MIAPENIHAAKKLLADCCGKKPNLRQLAHLIGVAAPPPVYQLKRGTASILPTSGVRSFSMYAIEALGGEAPESDDPIAALSRLLDSLSAKR